MSKHKMARKHRIMEEGRNSHNHDRWLISYADFITLLFAFFVVMYSVSSVNEGKYRVLSNSLTTAFGKATSSISPISLNTTAPRSSLVEPAVKNIDTLEWPSIDNPIPGINIKPGDSGRQDTYQRDIDAMAADISDSMETLLEEELVKITQGSAGMEVAINTNFLFPSGSAQLHKASLPTLIKIANVLKEKKLSVKVEGFTDNVPISNEIYQSNWELSAGRAASVVHLFTRYGIDPKNMSAVGYGEFKPVASNTTEKGRRANRRVVIVVSPKQVGKVSMDVSGKN